MENPELFSFLLSFHLLVADGRLSRSPRVEDNPALWSPWQRAHPFSDEFAFDRQPEIDDMISACSMIHIHILLSQVWGKPNGNSIAWKLP